VKKGNRIEKSCCFIYENVFWLFGFQVTFKGGMNHQKDTKIKIHSAIGEFTTTA
jgi:hypothetical protein